MLHPDTLSLPEWCLDSEFTTIHQRRVYATSAKDLDSIRNRDLCRQKVGLGGEGPVGGTRKFRSRSSGHSSIRSHRDHFLHLGH